MLVQTEEDGAGSSKTLYERHSARTSQRKLLRVVCCCARHGRFRATSLPEKVFKFPNKSLSRISLLLRGSGERNVDADHVHPDCFAFVSKHVKDYDAQKPGVLVSGSTRGCHERVIVSLESASLSKACFDCGLRRMRIGMMADRSSRRQ